VTLVPARLRAGIIGAGVIGRRHVRTLKRFADVEVAAVADVDLERARELAATVGATPYADLRAMLDAERLDAVWVCLPPFAHGEAELEVIDRALPMFVEKPLAADLETAERIATRVAERGLLTGVGYHWRWLDTVERAQELLAERPGRLVSGYWLDSTPPIAWWQRQELSGGQFVEQTTHVVDLARLLVGEVEEVFAYAGRLDREAFRDSTVWDATAVSARFAGGAVGSFSSTCLLGWPHRIGLHIYGDELAVEVSEKAMVVRTPDGERRMEASGDPFESEDRAFLDAVRGEPDRTRVTYEEALKTLRVTTTALRSAAAGTPLAVTPDRSVAHG
jgi:predicted dehydrogenase